MPNSIEDAETHTEDEGLIWSCFINWVNTLEKVRNLSEQS